MFEGLDLPALGYRVLESTATDLATHVVLGRWKNQLTFESAGSPLDRWRAADHHPPLTASSDPMPAFETSLRLSG